MQADQHLARAGQAQVGHLVELQDLGATETVDANGAHLTSSFLPACLGNAAGAS